MAKKPNDSCIAILFSIIWIIRPISYDEMRSRHPISRQENPAVINRPSISIENEEFDFFYSEIPVFLIQLESGLANRETVILESIKSKYS